MAVSLFNAILLIWLGLTVLLNTERRVWAVWLASIGLLLGGAFFVSHSAILGRGLLAYDWGMIFWWTVGLVPAILLPFSWYIIILWYSGFGVTSSRLRKRHRWWILILALTMLTGLFAAGLGILLLTNISSTNNGIIFLRNLIRWSIAGIPLLAAAYTVYIFSCILLSLDALRHDALRHPEESDRIMGALARDRARPWLTAATIFLLAVCVLAGGIVLYSVQQTRTQLFFNFYVEEIGLLIWFDLIIASLIAIVILLLGQSIVAYEVFTGKTLPRRGLFRHWRRAVVLAGGYGIVIAGAFAFNIQAIHSLMLTTVLMTTFYALFNWRSFAERERLLDNLRPFVSGPRLYDQLLATESAASGDARSMSQAFTVDINRPFQSLCREVLSAESAYLVALGPMAPLMGPPLSFPADTLPVPLKGLSELTEQLQSTTQICIPLAENHPFDYLGGAAWAVPLWSERGLIGVFLLGPQLGGGLYTEETIAIARASGERLIDMQASAELAHRLVGVQRQQLADNQIIDRRARRILHDDILPYLHTAMLALSRVDKEPAARDETINLLTTAHQEISELLREMPTGAAPQINRSGLVTALRRAVDDELATAFDNIRWDVSSDASEVAHEIAPLTGEVVFYAAREAIRNAARYGRGDQPETPLDLAILIDLKPRQRNEKEIIPAKELMLIIEDNGVGLQSNSNGSKGSGHGLALHSTMMAVIGGELVIESIPNQFTRVTLTLPVTPT